jgi:RHS repeat-associated protein
MKHLFGFLSVLTFGGSLPVSAQNLLWSYDSFGNRTAQTSSTSNLPSTWAQYSPANNRLTSTNLAIGSMQYDAAGDVLFDGVNSYLFDAEGRVCAVGSGSTFIGYIYDGDGTRVAKGSINGLNCNLSSNGFTLTKSYIHGAKGELLTEMGANGAWVYSDVYANGRLVATYHDTNTYFALNDWLGTKRAEVSAAGCLSTYSSLPFGDDLTPTGNCPDASEQHFTGKERDAESGLDYFDARYYASSMGRFMSPDWSAKEDPVPYAKLGNPQTLNLYSYVLNNPLSLIDDDGHENRLAANANAQDRADYARAVAYLSRDPGEKAIIKSLTDSQTVHTINFAHNDDDADQFDPTTNTVTWDPRSALATADGNGNVNGETQTPALGLGHELDHANGKETGTTANGADADYGGRGGKEEKRVITGSETNAAGTLHEGTRTNHNGTGYQSVSPTSRVPTQQGVQTLRASEAAHHQKRMWFHVKKNQNH